MRPPGGFPARRIFTPESLPNLQQPKQLGTVHLRPKADLSGFEKGPLPDLSAPVAVIGPGAIEVIGGMTTRLAVASQIFPGEIATAYAKLASEAALTIDEVIPWAARKALSAADVLIAMELSDRQEAFKKAEEQAKQAAA